LTLCPDDDVESFVLANVTDPALSQSRFAQLPRRPLQNSDGGEAA
jgi:hypothetical protein